MKAAGTTAFRGRLKMNVLRYPRPGWHGFWTHALPHPGLGREINMWRVRNLHRTIPQWLKVSLGVGVGRLCGTTTMYGRLSHRVVRGDGTVLDYGIAGYKVVTTAFVNAVVDALQADQTFENFKYHGWGTGSTAEAVGDTALVTELTTEYVTNSTRVTGTQLEGATANIYKSVATLDPDSGGTIVLREHGLFMAATGATTLMDRTVFGAITLDEPAGDTLQSTYELTCTAGG